MYDVAFSGQDKGGAHVVFHVGMDTMRLRVARFVGWPYRHHPDMVCFSMRALFILYAVLAAVHALH